jgi:hypothetical protein
MTKQELAHIAKAMYELQEYCRWVNGGERFNPYDKQCGKCPLRLLDCSFNKTSIIMPLYWDITKADIERLERESNDD